MGFFAFDSGDFTRDIHAWNSNEIIDFYFFIIHFFLFLFFASIMPAILQ